MAYRILLVEDEENLREAIQLNLEMEGYEVDTAADGKRAIKLYEERHYNLLVLDVMLPELSGFEVCEKIRTLDSNIPILFLTAKDTSQDKINGLKLGADDYLTKPFNLEELLLRVQVLVKHSLKGNLKNHSSLSYSFQGNEVNFVTFEAKSFNGQTYNLTKKEVALLKLLIDRKNTVVSRDLILKLVWGYDVFPSTRTIDNFLLAFRKYFEADPHNPVFFHSIRSVGYKFTDGTDSQ